MKSSEQERAVVRCIYLMVSLLPPSHHIIMNGDASNDVEKQKDIIYDSSISTHDYQIYHTQNMNISPQQNISDITFTQKNIVHNQNMNNEQYNDLMPHSDTNEQNADVDILNMMAEEASSRLSTSTLDTSINITDIYTNETKNDTDALLLRTLSSATRSEWGPGDGTIHCICGNANDDNGLTIQCELCYVWQHAKCVGITKHAIPDSYHCHKCEPSRPKQRSQSIDTKPIKHSPKTPDISYSECISIDQESEYTHLDEHVYSEEAFCIIQSIWKQYDSSQSIDSHVLDHHSTLFIPKSSWNIKFPHIKRKEFKFRILGDSLLEALVASMAYPLSCMDTITSRLLSTLESKSHHRLDYFKRSGVFATQTIHSGSIITCLTGNIKTKYEFRKEILVKAYPHRYHSYHCLKHSQHLDELFVYRVQPYVYFLPELDLVLDMQSSGNTTRFIRRSCHPNVYIRGVFVYDINNEHSFHLVLFARDTIHPGDELFLPFDYQNGNRYHRYHCNCHMPSFCLAESPFPEITDTTSHVFFSNASTYSLPTSSTSFVQSSDNSLLFSGSISTTKNQKKSKVKVAKILKQTTKKAPNTDDIQTDDEVKQEIKSEQKQHKQIGAVSMPSTPTKTRIGSTPPSDHYGTSTAPPSPGTIQSLSREERKLKMYIETIQRNEERERKKQQRIQHRQEHGSPQSIQGSKSAPVSSPPSVISSSRSSPKPFGDRKRKKSYDDLFVRPLIPNGPPDDIGLEEKDSDHHISHVDID